ncbi:regulatory factor X-associated protein [Herpailurus yagouaroundi]|uniref:regulatory factor X-associated protein n=1 Tax=Herpailurus yagouaroundi TaxID=1608482 RepID=UPI001AD77143|nr:regulatory factor X-associated protein [Puma yagouaroundi]
MMSWCFPEYHPRNQWHFQEYVMDPTCHVKKASKFNVKNVVNRQPRGKFKEEIFATAEEGIPLTEKAPEEAEGMRLSPDIVGFSKKRGLTERAERDFNCTQSLHSSGGASAAKRNAALPASAAAALAQSAPSRAAQPRPSEMRSSQKGARQRNAHPEPFPLRGLWLAKCRWASHLLEGWGRGPPQGVSSTEVQGVVEGAGPGAAGGALRPGAPATALGQALAPASVPAPASQFTLLVMHPCGGQDESAAEGVLRQPPALGDGAGTGKSIRYLCEVAGAGEEEAGEDEADLLDTSDAPGGGESTASLEDLEDEETHSGGEGGSGGARRRGGGGGSMSKTCTFEGCSETTSQVAKQRKPWMCKKHRNKMYKDKYKKKKSDQALNCSGAAQPGSAGNVRLEESTDNILSIVKQRTGTFGDRPARPTLLEQVLNQKRLSLLRSPEVVQFLQKQQQLLNQQVLEQRQQQFPGTSV